MDGTKEEDSNRNRNAQVEKLKNNPPCVSFLDNQTNQSDQHGESMVCYQDDGESHEQFHGQEADYSAPRPTAAQKLQRFASQETPEAINKLPLEQL